MPFIYSIEIETDAKEDVNQKFREKKLKGEVVVDEIGKIYICPQISTKLWNIYPKSRQPNDKYDERWDQVIEDTLIYMESHHSVKVMDRKPKWRHVTKLFRCPKMLLSIKLHDLSIH